MFLRFAYSPSFETGWAVGVQIDVQTVVGSDKEEVHRHAFEDIAYGSGIGACPRLGVIVSKDFDNSRLI